MQTRQGRADRKFGHSLGSREQPPPGPVSLRFSCRSWQFVAERKTPKKRKKIIKKKGCFSALWVMFFSGHHAEPRGTAVTAGPKGAGQETLQDSALLRALAANLPGAAAPLQPVSGRESPEKKK